MIQRAVRYNGYVNAKETFAVGQRHRQMARRLALKRDGRDERQERIAEAARVNQVEAKRCPFCFRYKALSVAMHEQHERGCYKRKKLQLAQDRAKKREALRKSRVSR